MVSRTAGTRRRVAGRESASAASYALAPVETVGGAVAEPSLARWRCARTAAAGLLQRRIPPPCTPLADGGGVPSTSGGYQRVVFPDTAAAAAA